MTGNTINALIIVACLCWCCQIKQMDPAPSVEGGTGFTGTIEGKRLDGTTFKEDFAYSIATASEGLATVPGNLRLFRRASDGSYFELNLSMGKSGTAAQPLGLTIDRPTQILFQRETGGNKLFNLTARMLTRELRVTFPVDPANPNYSFDFEFQVWPDYPTAEAVVESSLEGNDWYSVFRTKLGEKVYFNQYGQFSKIVSADGQVSTTSAVYDQLLIQGGVYGPLAFYLPGLYGPVLSKPGTIQPDKYSIANYSYDAPTSTLSFDFQLRFGASPRTTLNKTGGELIVTGKFSGKVYNQIISGRINTGD